MHSIASTLLKLGSIALLCVSCTDGTVSPRNQNDTAFKISSVSPAAGTLNYFPTTATFSFSASPNQAVVEDETNWTISCTNSGSFIVQNVSLSGLVATVTLSKTATTAVNSVCTLTPSSLITDAAASEALEAFSVAWQAPADNFPVSFNTSGAHTFSVPTGCTTLHAKMWGGGGGGGYATGGAFGGGGGFASDSVAVTPGETLDIVVAGGGIRGRDTGTTGGEGGFGGGGNGGESGTGGWGGGGGGRSAVVRTGADLIVAGGGGGGASGLSGGSSFFTGRGGGGGGSVNIAGIGFVLSNCFGVGVATGGVGNVGGDGGTSDSGMNGGTGPGGGGGGGVLGGDGGNGVVQVCTTAPYGGNGGSGGTGMGAVNTAATNRFAANNTDLTYSSNAGLGGVGSTNVGTRTSGNPGLVVITGCN